MTDWTWEKVWGSVLAAFILKAAQLPPALWPLIALMFADLILGSILAIQKGEWRPRVFGAGIMRKLGAFFMLGATAAVTEYAFKVEWDALDVFIKAMSVYEFLSCADSYIKFGGPGSAWLTRFIGVVKAAFEAKKDIPTQEEVSQALDREKKAGQDAR